jgi:hypothetical protein
MLAELNEPANVPESAVGAFAPQRRTIHEKLDEQPRFSVSMEVELVAVPASKTRRVTY